MWNASLPNPPNIDCQTIGGTCPNPDHCKSDWESEGLVEMFWAVSSFHNFHTFMGQAHSAIDDAVLNTSLLVAPMLDDFPVQERDVPPLDKLLTIVGGVFGVLGSAWSLAPEGLGGPLIGGGLSALGGIFSLAAIPAAPDEDDEDKTLALLNGRLSAIFSALLGAVEKSLVDVFGTGNMDDWPDALANTGEYYWGMANLFDNGRFYYPVDTTDLEAGLSRAIQKTIIGELLRVDNWWILRDAYTQEVCETVVGAQWILNHCYSLEKPGRGYSSGMVGPMVHNDFSKPVDEDTLKKITDTWKLNMEELYMSSYFCQREKETYGGTITLDFDTLQESTNVPACWYSLPVLYVRPDDRADGFIHSVPCSIVTKNDTASTPQVGVTYLPDNINKIMTTGLYCCFPLPAPEFHGCAPDMWDLGDILEA